MSRSDRTPVGPTAPGRAQPRRVGRRLIAVVFAGTLIASCAADDESTASPLVEAPAAIGEDAPEGADSITAEQLASTAQRNEIVEANVVLAVTDVAAASTAVTDLAIANGGEVRRAEVRFDVDGSGNDSGNAYVVLGIPPSSLDAVIDELTAFGSLVTRTQQTEDVTDQVVDLESRITSARRSIGRVQDLLDEANDLDDVVLLERELTARQTDLESLLATQSVLAARTELATLSVEIRAVAQPDDGIADALGTGGRAFVRALEALVVTLAYLAPFLALASLIVGAVWVSRRRARRNRSVARPTPPTPPRGP
jgi:hypothetical protein